MIEVELPDGSIAEFPDGTSPDTMKQALAKYRQPTSREPWQPTKRTPADIQAAAQKSEFASDGKTSWGDAALSAAGKKYQETGLGAAQWALQGGPMASTIDAGLKLAGLERPVDPASAYINGKLAENSEADAKLMQQPGSGWGNTAAVLSQFALPGAGAKYAATKAPTLASGLNALAAPRTLGGAATQGAVFGGLDPVSDGESRTMNAAVSALGSMAGQKVGDLLGASARAAKDRVAPEVRRLYEAAKARGVNLTPAQLTDSQFIKRLSGMLDSLPFSGANKRATAQNQAGNRALAETIGQKADTLDSTVLGRAADELGKKFDQVFSAGAKYDTQFLREVAQLKQQADEMLDDTARRTIDGWVNRIREQAQGGAMTPRLLQSLDQAARKAATGGGDRQQIATAFREALHENFNRNAPKAVQESWRTIRRQWANLKTLEPLVARHPEGGVPMTQVLGAVNATQRGRQAVARGKGGEIVELAKIGQRMKKPNSSGTGENVQASAIGAGSIANLPLTLASLGGGSALARLLASKNVARFQMRQPGTIRAGLAPAAQPAGLLSGLFLADDENR